MYPAIVMSLAVACIVASSTAFPAYDTLSFDLADVMEKSVCPIKIRIDTNENRIPRRIKMLECAKTPNPMCHMEKLTHACCRSLHHGYHTQCVNVVDHVLVRYRNNGDDEKLHKYSVNVGCSCMIIEGTSAISHD